MPSLDSDRHFRVYESKKKHLMYLHRNVRNGYAWLEVLLALAMLLLLLQIFPSLREVIDFRNWSRTTAVVVNALAVLVLLGVRASPNLITDFREKLENG